MKTRFHFSLWLLVSVCLWQTKLAQGVTFTNTPTVVSNTYNGTITLQIGGLTNTETVVVQKYLDLNTNGVIDAGDLLVQQFTLQDGANFVIGGVTNFNVPGDLNATPGAITATLNFQTGDFIQNLVGRYLFKLSRASGPVATNLFTVTNVNYAQKFTGNVVSNGTPTMVTNAIILLFPPPVPGNNGPSGSPLAGVVANNAGGYTVQLPAGTYSPLAFSGGYVGNYATAPVLTLTNTQTITTNLTLIKATNSISGTVVDAGNPSLGLPGVLFPAMTTNGLLTVAFTGTNGSFTMPVTAGGWKMKADDMGLIIHGYLGSQNGTNVTAGGTGVTLTAPKATALIYGSVKDILGNPLVGLDMYSEDNNNFLYQTDGYTDMNGNYSLGVVGGLTNDPWWIQTDSNNTLTNYIFSQPDYGTNNGTNMSLNAAAQINFTGILATNRITGNVKANGTNIMGVGVLAAMTTNSVNFYQYMDTDTNGNYSLTVAGGTWSISVNCNGGSDSLDTKLGAGTYQWPTNRSAVISNNNATNNFTIQPCGGIKILTTNLPSGQVNSYYNQFLQGASCDGTLNWSLNDPTNFPSSLGWSGNGQIQGTPNTSGTYNFFVHLDDGNGHATNQSLSLYIAPAALPLQVTTTSLPGGSNGVSYSQQLQFSGGQPPCHWSLSPGSASLPANLTLTTNGVISGTPTTNGTFYFYVRVTDSTAATADQPLSLAISSPPLQVTTATLPAATQNASYNTTLAAAGGQPPYTWGLAPGSASLPLGLTLTTNGVISGKPNGSGTSQFIVLVADVTATWTYQVLSLTVNTSAIPPVIVLTAPVSPGNGQLQFAFNTASGVNYTIQYSADMKTWLPLLTFSGSGGLQTIMVPSATGQRFYRVKVGL